MNYLQHLTGDICTAYKFIISHLKSIVSYRSLAIFLSVPIIFSIFFWVVLEPPLAEPRDIATIYVLIILFAVLLVFSIQWKEWRRFLFYQILPYLILAEEMINFGLTSQFDAGLPLRYGFGFVILGMLADAGMTVALSSFRLKKISAVFSVLWQIMLASPFIGVLFRNFNGTKLEQETVTAIFQTDLTEAVYYVWEHGNILLSVLAVLLLTAAGIFFYCRLPQFPAHPRNGCRIAAAVIGLALTVIMPFAIHSLYRKGKLWLFFLLKKGGEFRQELIAFNEQAAKRRMTALTPEESTKVLTKGSNGRFLLIIGESNSREYMDCYGYSRNTTPFLSGMLKDERFTFFTQAYANHVHTNHALKLFLTEGNQYRTGKNFGVTLFDVLRYCGYKTFFISNQYVYDSFRSPVSAISQSADWIKYINTEMDFVARKNRLDIETVNELKQLELGERSVAVIHLMSCHAPYQIRYPRGFREDLPMHYERATAYLDHVLSQFFEYAMKNDFIDGVIFIPDHGEDVALEDHDSAMYTPEMTRIPMVCYLSSTYIRKNPQLHEKVKKAANRVFTNDLSFDFVLDVLGISTAFNADELHILSDNYSLDMSNAKTLHGKAKLEEKFDR